MLTSSNQNDINNNDFRSIITMILSGKIPLTLAVQWLSSTKSSKYSISNDYTSVRELNQRSPLQFSHYLVDELRNSFNIIYNVINNSNSNNNVNSNKHKIKNENKSDFPPLPIKVSKGETTQKKDQTTSSQHQQQLQILPILVKEESDQLDSIVELYSNVLFNRLYHSTLMSELNFLVKILTSLQKIINISQQWHLLSIDQQSLQQQPLPLFINVSWALHFVLRTLSSIQPILYTLNPKFLIQLSDNQIVEKFDKTLSSSLKSNAMRALEDFRMLGLENKKNNSRITSPFRSLGELDNPYHKKLRKAEDTQIYTNREKCLDSFHELLRIFQVDPRSLNPMTSINIVSLTQKTKEFFGNLYRNNLWWFCDLFIDQYQQCKQSEIDDTVLNSKARAGLVPDSPWSQGAPDKMALLQKRMEQGSNQHQQPPQLPPSQPTTAVQQPSTTTVIHSSQEKMKLLQNRMETPNSIPTPSVPTNSKPKRTVIPFGITSPSKHNQQQQHHHQQHHQQQQQANINNNNYNSNSFNNNKENSINLNSQFQQNITTTPTPTNINNQYARLMTYFSVREHFFLYFVLAYDNHQFYHHLQASIVEKISILQSCQCSNNHNHSDYHERVTHLKSLLRLLAFIYMLPTENYQKPSMALQSPSFAEITNRTNLLPPPFDLRSMLMNAISAESLAVAVPSVIEFIRMADNVTRETAYFQDLINILKNIYMLPTIIPTANQAFYNYTSLFIQLELEQYFETSGQSPTNYTHIALPFSGALFAAGSPTSTPRTPTTPSKSNTPASPTHTKTPSKSNNSNNNTAAIDLSPTIGYTLLWSYPNYSYLGDAHKSLADAAIEAAELVATTNNSNNNNQHNTVQSSGDSPVSSPSKQLLKRKQNVPIKKITPIAAQPVTLLENSETQLQSQLEWWFFWSHPGLAKLSNLLQDTLLPFFTEMIFNLSIPITIKLANTYIEENKKLVSPASSPSKPSNESNHASATGDSVLIEGSRLQELVMSVQQRLRHQASEKVKHYCQNNIRSIISLLTPMEIDDSVLSVATSMISRRLARQAESLCIPEVLQKARVLAIEIIAKKQSVSLNKTSLQLLNISMSDVTKANQQNFTIVGIAQSQLAVLDEVLDLRTTCNKLEKFGQQIAAILDANTATNSTNNGEDSSAANVAQLDQSLQNEIMTTLIKTSALMDADLDASPQLKNSLPIIFKLVVHLMSNLMMLDYRLNPPQLMPMPLIPNAEHHQQQLQQQSTLAIEELQQPLQINRLTNHKLGNSFVDLIKKMVKMNAEFTMLLPQYLLSHTKVFTIVLQFNTFSLEWLHSYDWVLLTLLQDNVIDCVSVEGCWINLLDRCFSFILENTLNNTGIANNNNNENSADNNNNNGTLLQIQTLQSFLKVICEFIKLYHFHFQNYYVKENINNNVKDNSNNNNNSIVKDKHPYEKSNFNLCLDNFLHRLIKVKSMDKFNSITDLATTLDQSIQYLRNQILLIFNKTSEK